MISIEEAEVLLPRALGTVGALLEAVRQVDPARAAWLAEAAAEVLSEWARPVWPEWRMN